MVNLLVFIQKLIRLYEFILIVAVVMSWLFASGKVSRYDPRLRDVMSVLDSLTQPLLRRIRPFMPKTGAVDLSPVALWLICMFVDTVVIETLVEWVT